MVFCVKNHGLRVEACERDTHGLVRSDLCVRDESRGRELKLLYHANLLVQTCCDVFANFTTLRF